MIEIEQAENGYIVTFEETRTVVYLTAESLFAALLMKLEGRGEYFGGDNYGKVSIVRVSPVVTPDTEVKK